MRRVRVVVLAALAALAASCAAPSQPHPSVTTTSTMTTTMTSPGLGAAARSVDPDPRVGAVFLGGQSLHTCTGSVLASAADSLILTAAHCVADGIDAYFVPGFANSARPQDFWRIDEVYLDPRWVSDQNPLADFAIARVSRDGGGSIEAGAGAGFALGAVPKRGADVDVTGYVLGVGGQPIGCAAHTVAEHRGFPSLSCAGLVGGTSGSPWLVGSTIVGIIGGLEGGGCDENVSYTPPFDGAVTQLLARAEAGGPADVAPQAFDDDC